MHLKITMLGYRHMTPIMNVDPNGNSFFSILLGVGISSLVGWGLSQVLGSQIVGGIGSVINGDEAIATGIGLLAFDPVGWVLGGALILVGGATIAFGINEIIAGATGTNYIQQWTGMSNSTYNGWNVGLSIASGIGRIAGNIGMRFASNRILNSIVQNPSKINNYKLWQMKTYGRYTSQFTPGVMQRSSSNPVGGYNLTHISGAPKGHIQCHPGVGHHGPMPYWRVTGSMIPCGHRSDLTKIGVGYYSKLQEVAALKKCNSNLIINQEDINFYIKNAKMLASSFDDYITENIASDWTWQNLKAGILKMLDENLINEYIVNLF